VCGFWEIVHFSVLLKVPAVTTVISVFICAVEIRSVWEKAEKKQRRNALQTVEAFAQLLGKETVGEKLESVIGKLKGNQKENEQISEHEDL
jgi:hypothetical protein